MNSILRSTRLLSVVLLTFLSLTAMGQNNDNAEGLPSYFTSMTDDASLVCGVFLPSGIPGTTELMTLCGGRYAFRLNASGMLESQVLMGAGKGQVYRVLSSAYRFDFPIGDMIASFFAGLDLTIDTIPVLDPLYHVPVDSTTNWYGGIHFGGALWWAVSDTFFLRTDLQLNISPGSSLYILLSGVYRWGGTGGP